MNMNRYLGLVVCAALVVVHTSADAQTKLAQTGMKFLAVGTDARYAALGDGLTSVEGSVNALFYNPAGVGRLTSLVNVGVGRTEWIADFAQWYGSVTFAPSAGDYGVFGLSFQTADYGEFEGTVIAANEKGYYDEGDIPGLNFKPGAYMVGLSYARALSNKVSIGGTVKYVFQDLGDVTLSGGTQKVENENSVFAFDFGLIYQTGWKSLNFGMVVRNFAREVKYIDEGFQLPLTFRIGVSMNVLDLTTVDPETHGLLLSLDAEHARDYPEQVRFGLEYKFLRVLALRVGYINPADEQTFTYGAGVRLGKDDLALGVDYAFTPFGVFGDVHRFTFVFSL